MKTVLSNGIALALIAAAIVSCKPKNDGSETAPTADLVQIRTEIETMEASYADKMNMGKSDEIVYYADDATSFNQNKPPATGIESIRKAIKEDMVDAPKGAKIGFETHDIFPSVDGDQVVETGSYKLADSTGTTFASGNYMAVFQKKDGKYRCIRDMSASDRPKMEAKPMAMPEKKM